MKYLPLHAFILIGMSVFLTGCYRNDYDLTRTHDIYRMDYKYNPPAPQETVLPPAANGTSPVTAPQQPAGATAPAAAQPAVPPAAQ